ncbi:hypothetical protein BC832DRAFT_51919 [Gaertneriomyces semiglobifer]|nr:hypothetical protein BC832DRAFT_51919 [Gaertneriomyces semiglobifer]
MVNTRGESKCGRTVGSTYLQVSMRVYLRGGGGEGEKWAILRLSFFSSIVMVVVFCYPPMCDKYIILRLISS